MRYLSMIGMPAALGLFFGAVFGSLLAQQATRVPLVQSGDAAVADPAPWSALKLESAEVEKLVREMLDQPLSAQAGDRISFLARNYPGVVVPILKSRIMKPSPGDTSESRYHMASSIAYSGSSQGLAATLDLAVEDYTNFSHFVGQALNHTSLATNPYALVYRHLGSRPEAQDDLLVNWINEAPASDKHADAWTKAMQDRLGRTPDNADVTADPILMRLKGDRQAQASKALRESILRPRTKQVQ